MKILVDENLPLRLPKELADLAYHELLADERIEIAPEPMNLERKWTDLMRGPAGISM